MPQYQGVWTLEQQAQAQSNQQWVTDPNFKNTTLLLQADGTGSGSQNNTFLDGSTNNFFITRNGNTTQGSFSPFSQAPGYWGNYFTSAGLSIPYAAALQLENTNWTIEGYFNLSSASAEFCVMGASNGGGGVPKYFMGGNWSTSFTYNANRATFFTYTGGDRWIDVPYAWEIGKWYHMAAVYTSSNTTITLYINGVNVGSMAYGIGNVTGNVLIGRNGENGGPINGYISNFRYIVGTSLYTSNFTPSTTPLTAITNTQILTCQSNSFIDNSGNSRAVSIAAGTPSVQAFGPFAPALQWTPDVVGGSGYFDGSGDYLSIPSSSNLSLGTGDFTLECWVYPLSWNSSTDQNLFAGNAIYSPGLGGNLYYPGKLVFGYNGVVTIVDNATLPAVNTWTHVVATRASGVFRIFLNGTQSGSTVTYSADFSAPIVFVGTNGGTGFVNGYISGARVIKGTALYTSNFTPPTAPPTAVSGTQLLLNMTNAGIYDGKMANNLETVGNAQVATSPVKYGSGSMYFDGSGDFLSIPNTQAFNFGSGSFTIEFWALINTTSSEGCVFHNYNADNQGVMVSVNGVAGKWRFYAGNGSWFVTLDSSVLVTTGTWNHVACTRNNNTWTIWLNGVSVATTTNSSNPSMDSGPAFIGKFGDIAANNFNGYLDDFRITRACRYFANFTPPQQALPRQ